MHNLAWIAPLAVGLILVSAAIWLVVMWLSSRGRFMFLHCVAANAAEVRVPWARFGPAANSLFLFRLVISLIGLVVMLPLVGARKGPTPNAAADTRKASSGSGGRRRDWAYSIAVTLALGEVFGAAGRWRHGGAVTRKGHLPTDW
jgi:hypothetical protein